MLRREWAAALRDGVALSRKYAPGIADAGIDCVFYGDVFRSAGQMLGPGDPWLSAEDADVFEADLLNLWWEAAAATDPGVISPGDESLAGVRGGVQAALWALAGAVFFSGLAQRVLLADLRQVRLYMTDSVDR